MSTTVQGRATTDIVRRDELAGRVFRSILGMMDVVTIYLGDRLGLYQALVEGGPATSAELADRTGTHERYVREWLEQQAVAGLLDVAEPAAETAARYALPSAHAEVLLDRDSLSYMAPFARQMIGAVQPLPALLQAFRTGSGVPYLDYGPDMREGLSYGNRPLFINLLASAWLPAVPDVHARLQADPPARVVDVGCGSGWSSIAIAQAYPNVQVDGIDPDAPSIALARANVAAAGLAGRVTFHCCDASDPALAGHYDLVAAFECIHDMPQPVSVLRAMRGLLAEGGAVLIADERVAETFSAPGDDVERFMYGYSVLHCLPVGMADTPSAGTGTVMRPETLRRYGAEAGFRAVEILPIEADFWRFYRLMP
jgi:2-polyprenyl-3-methyl-5-hydroxy-6-metoxy-1,4-benzoquinol methylase